MNKIAFCSTCVLLLALHKEVAAQSIGPSVLNASGGSALRGGNTYEWSIGEMTLVHTASAGSIVVTQGILQPKTNSAGIQTVLISEGDLSVFPVPSTTVLNIKPDFKSSGIMGMALYDITGKTLIKTSVALRSGSEPQQLNIASFTDGNYMLVVSYDANGTHAQKTYKIQKVN